MQLQSSLHLGQGSPWLNEILFGVCPIDNIDSLSAYYFTKERYEIMKKEKSIEVIVETMSKNPIKEDAPIYVCLDTPKIDDPIKSIQLKKSNEFTTNHPDPLFWCIFAFQYGIGEYMQIQKYANRRLEENKKMGDFFKKSPKNLKMGNHAITNGLIQEIISDFFTTKDATFPIQLIAMAIYYNIRIILIKHGGQSYIEFQGQAPDKTCIVYEYIKPNKRMSYKINMAEDMPDLTQIYKWHTWNQPLRGQSAYKLAELAEIANRLKIDPIGLKKGDLYTKMANLFE